MKGESTFWKQCLISRTRQVPCAQKRSTDKLLTIDNHSGILLVVSHSLCVCMCVPGHSLRAMLNNLSPSGSVRSDLPNLKS